MSRQDSPDRRQWVILDSLRGYRLSYLPHDLLAGLIVAALTIPISMGYAQVAGLPPVYGLYGSILPIIGYALFSSSPQVIFGVDAAASAITGSILMGAGIAVGSSDAMSMAPVLAFLTGMFLLLFSALRMGRLVSFISTPVMGGFISGVAIAIMLTQIPKIMGVQTASSEGLINSIVLIAGAVPQTNVFALFIGIVAFIVIIVCRKLIPKVPMPIIVMIVAVFLSGKMDWETTQGIVVLGTIQPGLPMLSFPDFTFGKFTSMLGYAFTISVVIMAESLLASNTFAMRNHYRLNDNRELFAFAVGNILGSFVGVCPTSASVSRTAASDGYGGKTQVTSLVAVALIMIVLFLTPLLYAMPVSVLAAIVFAALTSVVEMDLAKRLWRCERLEFWIFIAAMAGVLLVGLLAGVVVGVFLSFLALLLRSSDPPRGQLGTLPGKDGYFNMKRFPQAEPLPGVLLYRFSSNMNFANARVFSNEIEDLATDDIRVVIVDASGIGRVDITAADRMAALYDTLTSKGKRLYIAEQTPALVDQLVKFGCTRLVDEGHAMRTIEDALVECDIDPYPGVTAEEFRIFLEENRNRMSARASDSIALGATDATAPERPDLEGLIRKR